MSSQANGDFRGIGRPRPGGGGGGGGRGAGGGRDAAGKDGKEGGKRFFFRRRKVCKFCADKIDYVDYKDVKLISQFVPERGKILPAAHVRNLRGAPAQADRGDQPRPPHRTPALRGGLTSARSGERGRW